MIPRTVKTIYEGAGVKGIKRAPKEVLERIVGKLNAVSDSRMRSKGMTPASMALEPRYTSNIQDVHAAITTGKATRPRVVMRDGEAFLVLHRGVSSGGKQALSGSKYQGKWGDVAQAPGFPASTHRGVAKIFAGDSPTKLRKQRSAVIAKSKSILEDPGSREYLHPNDRAYHEGVAAISRGGIKRSPDLKPSSRGKMRLKKPRPNIGAYLLPESEIDSAWVRPQSVFGPEWEVRHPQVGDHLARVRKHFSAKLRLRELARGEYLRRLIGYLDPVPARGAAEAVRDAGKLRHYRSNPVGREIERVRKEIIADPHLGKAARYKDTPALTVVTGEYDPTHEFPKRSRQTKWVIDNLNKHAARGKSWSVAKGALGQPIVRAEGIDRLLSAKLRLRELATIL